MDRSLGTIDVDKLKYENLADISEDSHDEDEERSKALDGLLLNAFDDLSSIGEDEEEESPIDSDNNRHDTSNHPYVTPYTTEHNGNRIPSPFPSSSDKDSGTGKSETGLHLRMLLEENAKLTAEVEKLKDQQQQNERRLLARITTLESNNKALAEDRNQLTKQLELAKATIRSFETQIEEMAKNEFLEGERNFYNGVLDDKEAKFRNERLDWLEKESKLKEDIELKESEITRLSDLKQHLEHKIKILEALQSTSSQKSKRHQATSPLHNHCYSPEPPHSPSPATKSTLPNQQPSNTDHTDCVPAKDVQNIVEVNVNNWIAKAEKTYQIAYAEQIQDLKKRIYIEKGNWESEVNQQVQLLSSWIETLSIDSHPRDLDEKTSLLAPLKKLWFVIETKFDEKKQALLEKKQEIEEAMRELEDAYNKSLENENSYDAPAIQELRDNLSKTQAEMEELKNKLQRYKHNYKKLYENTLHEREAMKLEFAKILREKLAEAAN